jgi:hypothetical protein
VSKLVKSLVCSRSSEEPINNLNNLSHATQIALRFANSKVTIVKSEKASGKDKLNNNNG